MLARKVAVKGWESMYDFTLVERWTTNFTGENDELEWSDYTRAPAKNSP